MGSCNSSPFNSLVTVGMFWFSAFVGGRGGRIIYLKLPKITIFRYEMCQFVTCISPHFMHVPQFWIYINYSFLQFLQLMSLFTQNITADLRKFFMVK